MSYEEFVVALDERFGQSLWSDFPEVANKGEYDSKEMYYGETCLK